LRPFARQRYGGELGWKWNYYSNCFSEQKCAVLPNDGTGIIPLPYFSTRTVEKFALAWAMSAFFLGYNNN
jgi:hypothetical protein